MCRLLRAGALRREVRRHPRWGSLPRRAPDAASPDAASAPPDEPRQSLLARRRDHPSSQPPLRRPGASWS
eukprot:2012412-Prymnesium_polylepis.2